MGVFWSEKQGNGLSKIGPSSCSPGAARECNLKRGVPLHEQITDFMPPIICIYLWLSQITRPFERRSRGGGEWRERPRLFVARASLYPRFNLHHGGTWTPPQWGVAPATVTPAGRLEVWSCKGLWN